MIVTKNKQSDFKHQTSVSASPPDLNPAATKKTPEHQKESLRQPSQSRYNCLLNIANITRNICSRLPMNTAGHHTLAHDTVVSSPKCNNIPPSEVHSTLWNPQKSVEYMVKSDYALLCLLQMHLSDAQNIEESFNNAIKEVGDFLTNNGPNGNYLKDYRLKKLSTYLQNNKNIMQQILSEPARSLCVMIHKEDLANHQFDINGIIPNLNRIDKKEIGLSHTLIGVQDTVLKKCQNKEDTTKIIWIEMYKTYDLSNPRDKQIMHDLHTRVLIPQHKTITDPNDPSPKFSTHLGEGSFGSVIVGRNLKTKTHCAVKKVTQNPKEGLKEMSTNEQLHQDLKQNTKHNFLLIDAATLTSGTQKYNKDGTPKTKTQKVYLVSALAEEGNEATQRIKNIKLKRNNNLRDFYINNLQQIKLFVTLIRSLKDNNRVHTDLKPHNIFGKRLADLGDVIKEGHKIETHTLAYTSPHAYKIYTKQGALTGQAFSTFNYFSLGVMLIESITGKLPTSKDIHTELRLPYKELASPDPKKKRRVATQGYTTQTLNDLPEGFSQYERQVLLFAKYLMADNLNTADALNLDAWVDKLEESLTQELQTLLASGTKPT